MDGKRLLIGRKLATANAAHWVDFSQAALRTKHSRKQTIQSLSHNNFSTDLENNIKE